MTPRLPAARRLALFCLTTLWFHFGCASLRPTTRPAPEVDAVAVLTHALDTALSDSALQQTHAHVKIVSLARDEILYQRDGRYLLHPASNQKLLTTAAALNFLGPSYRFKTLLYADSGAVSDSVVSGNLYLKGFGDPGLSTADLHHMVDELTTLGIGLIEGDIVCDDTYFDSLRVGVGWMWDDGPVGGYYSPISALALNSNTVELRIRPGEYPEEPVRVRMLPPTAYMTIDNQAVTLSRPDSAMELEVRRDPLRNRVEVLGGMPVGTSEETYLVDVVDPALYAGTVFHEMLAGAGIEVRGRVLKGVVPDSVVVLLVHESAPLSQAVQYTNKESHNLSAEMLLKGVGAAFMGPPGTAEKGLDAIRLMFTEIGVDTSRLEIVDGSGVSRYNLISPDILIEWLRAAYENPRWGAEFVASLPIAGVDGTLENRMRGTPAEGVLRAKTGSLAGISSLAGYTTTEDGETLAFSMIFGHFVGEPGPIRRVQDRIGAILTSFRRQLATY